MRQAVAGIHEGRAFHGQVIGYNGTTLSVRCSNRVLTVEAANVREVAPVLCFLLYKAPVPASLDAAAMANMHHVILDRLLGENGSAASRDIGQLLRGFVARNRQPAGYDTIDWIHPSTGLSVTVSIQHAVDYGFSVDGGNRLPDDATTLVGPSFCDDPRFCDASGAAADTATNARLNALLQELSDSEELDSNQHATRRVTNTTSRTPTSAEDIDTHVQIVAQLASQPALLRAYLATILPPQPARPRRRREADDEGDIRGVARPRRLPAMSDLLPGPDATNRRESHSFRPSSIQRLIHDTITSPDHRGKSPSAFMDFVLSSNATKFMPHPAILSRLYAFEFGVYGLSIRHFVRVSHRSRRDWYNNSTINLHNFSPTVERPAPTRFATIQALSDALTVLGVFADRSKSA